MLLTPNNIAFYATFLHSDVVLQGRVIQFGSGVANEKLIVVPIGEVDPHATIVITVGLDKSYSNTDNSDPLVGISDGTNENLFIMADMNNYASYSPCRPYPANHDDTRVSSTTQAPSTLKLTFSPFNKFGFCETAQEGGYINTGTFNSQIDITKPLFLTVKRDHATELYYFHYFKVEIYEGI